jgi:hypothetical protein
MRTILVLESDVQYFAVTCGAWCRQLAYVPEKFCTAFMVPLSHCENLGMGRWRAYACMLLRFQTGIDKCLCTVGQLSHRFQGIVVNWRQPSTAISIPPDTYHVRSQTQKSFEFTT